MDLRDQYRGVLVGVHIGDSLGAPYETWGPTKIAADLAERGGLTFFDYPNPWAKDGNGAILPAGRPTDDSDQTADLCYSLLTCNGIDRAHLRNSLQNSVRRNVSRLWDGKATGAGGTTRDVLSDDEERQRRGFSNTIGTNGSLMRCSPMALWFGPSVGWDAGQLEWQLAVQAMSEVTHTHPHAVDSCWFYTLVLCGLISGEQPTFGTISEASKLALEDCETNLPERIRLRLADRHCLPVDPGAWPARGTAEFSLYVALYSLLNSTSFAEGIEMAIRVGGDTDTYAAIAGGLLGAHHGYSSIPEEWRQAILGHDVMVDFADQFYDRIVARQSTVAAT